MIKISASSLFLLVSSILFSQNFKFQSVSWGFAPLNSQFIPNYFEDKSLIFINLDKNKVTILDEDETTFYIYKREPTYTNENKDRFTAFKAAASDGEKLEIIMVDLHKYDEKHGSSKQLVLKYDMLYEIYNINDLE